ncbi:unnamed protein product [Pedinophyceae sp. YPF-701]|nr:unnamed protein product [Pedinophyceae sp. YPF-701]
MPGRVQCGVLLREFISHSLYHPTKGFFNRRATPVGRLPAPIDFPALPGAGAYKAIVAHVFRELGVSFLTPGEIFRPYYGHAVARWILEEHRRAARRAAPQRLNLQVYELGAGRASLACDILDYFRDHAAEVYGRMRYATVEASRELAGRQRQAFDERGHGRVASVQQRDASTAAGWGRRDARHCVVIATEVLDNMPHDRVVARAHGGVSELHETWVVPRADAAPQDWMDNADGSSVIEELRPLSDVLIRRTLAAYQSSRESPDAWPALQAEARVSAGSRLGSFVDWLAGGSASSAASVRGSDEGDAILHLPTTATRFFDALHAARPNHSLLMADFDALPGVQIPGVNAPLVSELIAGEGHRDHPSYLIPAGRADIFYPSDFPALCASYLSSAQHSKRAEERAPRPSHADSTAQCSHEQSRSFLQRWAPWERATTGSGYNPMLEEFPNTRFLTARSL